MLTVKISGPTLNVETEYAICVHFYRWSMPHDGEIFRITGCSLHDKTIPCEHPSTHPRICTTHWNNDSMPNIDGTNRSRVTGTAACHPLDQFDKERGRKLALVRALKTWGCNRETRRIVWEAYFARGVR